MSYSDFLRAQEEAKTKCIERLRNIEWPTYCPENVREIEDEPDPWYRRLWRWLLRKIQRRNDGE